MYVQQTVVLFKAEKVQEVQSTLEVLSGRGRGVKLTPSIFWLYIFAAWPIVKSFGTTDTSFDTN